MSEVIYWRVVETPLAPVFIAASATGVLSIQLDVEADRALEHLAARAEPDVRLLEGGAVIDDAAAQVEQYFSGRRTGINVPLDIEPGSEFARAVIDTVRRIPAGETMSYGDVAAAAGYPRAARAVGSVMCKNRLLLAVPCHRVVASGGLGGFGGRPHLKRWLLEHEGAVPTRSATPAPRSGRGARET